MGMSVANQIGNLIFDKGYDMVIDSTQAGYTIFGFAPSGTKPSACNWWIYRLKNTYEGQLNWFRWANGKGLNARYVWNTNDLEDIYDGPMDIF